MGFWGSSLYSNDCTCDVRDTYLSLLQEQRSNEEACRCVLDDFHECFGTDEEPLFWYALADTQWRVGRLMPDVREKALYWLEREGGIDFWEEYPRGRAGWRKTLAKLEETLRKPQRKEKKIENPADFQYIPGEPGAVFAYCFHTKEAQEMGYAGKFILMQVLGTEENGYGYTCPHMVAYDKLFSAIPEKLNLNDLRILPFDVPERFMPGGRNRDFPNLNISAVLELAKKRNHPGKHMTYVGTFPIPESAPKQSGKNAEFGWDSIEPTLLYYHSEWQKYSYQLLEDEAIVWLREYG